MEIDLLHEMIRDRETSIQFLEKKVVGQDEKEKRLGKQQDELAEKKQTNREEHRSELLALWKDYDSQLRRYQHSKDVLDTKKQQQQQQQQQQGNNINGGVGGGQQQQQAGPGTNVDVDVYNEIMKAVAMSADGGTAGAGTDHSSNYVVRMQSQLCKAMHGMGVMETQRQLTKGQMEHIQKKAKDVITDMVEEQSQVELKMVNELIVADNSKRAVETKQTLQHDTFFKQKNDLMDKIERQLNEEASSSNNIDGEDDGDGDDDEYDDDAAKEELREILEQGREEMDRLKKLNEETEKKVEALKIRAAIAQGQDVVDDIVTSIADEFAEREGSGDEGSDDGSY